MGRLRWEGDRGLEMEVPRRSLWGKSQQAAGWLGLGALVCLAERLDTTLPAMGSHRPF